MSMIEIVRPTQKDLYDKAMRSVNMAYGLMSNTDPVSDLLDDIRFYLMEFPPQEEEKKAMEDQIAKAIVTLEEKIRGLEELISATSPDPHTVTFTTT